MNFIALVTIIFLELSSVSSYKILCLYFHPGKSHFDVSLPFLKRLVNKGHELTVVTYFPRPNSIPGFKDVSVRDAFPPSIENIEVDDLYWGTLKIRQYMEINKLWEFADDACRAIYNFSEFQKLLNSNQTFDLIIAEMFNTECLLAVRHKFQVPIVGISTCDLPFWMYDKFGLPSTPSYIPNVVMEYGDDMSFWQRLDNTIVTVWQYFLYNYGVLANDNEIVHKYISEDLPDIRSFQKYISLLLVNTHFTLTSPRPLTPNVIQVGGIHVGIPKQLPKDIEKFINESKAGVIYFSLGSLIKGHTFPEDKRREFLKAFSRIPQRVLWKWENETMPGKPDNVMIQKWMPQLDILCHPNVKAFISHGGLLGLTEAVHCGVPTVVMPQFGDQYTNAKALEANGGGVILDLSEATEELVYNALQTVLNPKFHQQAKELSERFRDRPMSPMDTAIYWVEYVARHKGAYHMRTAAVDMPLYQYLLLDVISFILVVLLLVFYIIYKLLKFVISLFVKPTKLKKQ